jgi:regulator of replication initiation timing
MAVRSGAGTGVIVSLVVFVLTTVFLLVMTIVFYAGKTEAQQQAAEAQSQLATYVTPQQRSSDRFKNLQQAAGRQSVAGYLNQLNEELMQYISGSPTMSVEQLRAEMANFGVEENGTVRNRLEDLTRENRSLTIEVEGLQSQLAERQEELEQKEEQIASLKESHERELQEVRQEIVTYRQAAEEYGSDVRSTIQSVEQTIDRLNDEHRAEVDDLEDELDRLSQELVLLRSRVDEYEDVLDEIRIKGKDPAMLVDATVIDVEPANERVFIDRGRDDRIVLGMTFEVYDDAASIRVNEQTNELPRGKASIQIVKVGKTTSTGKITRSVPGRPVVRNNVVANAIYDPDYRFRFLVHGKFDVDGDGRPSEAEADYLRSLIVEWGGEVVEGDELPGDLDFLVLGEEPPLPPPLGMNATQRQLEDWLQKKEANRQYNELRDQAANAQIPVLNANRLFILIGRTDR